MLENCPAAAWTQQDSLQALFPTPPQPPILVLEFTAKAQREVLLMPLDGDVERSLSPATKPSSQFPVQADVKTDSRCVSAKSLSSFHSQPYSSTIRMSTARQANVAEQTQTFVAQDSNFLPVLLSGNHPITTTKPESFAHKDASKSSVLSYSLGKWLPAFSDDKLPCELLIHPLPYHFLPCPSEHFKYT